MSEMTPKEIVHELDKHIVGQADAKRAVAIALRNRWRRAQVAEPLRTEITPKNILMIGPTGVGKTELARRRGGVPAGGAAEPTSTRQRFRKMLREGKLDDKEIEIDVAQAGSGGM